MKRSVTITDVFEGECGYTESANGKVSIAFSNRNAKRYVRVGEIIRIGGQLYTVSKVTPAGAATKLELSK